nr:hypothetical protein [Tanacetum cinerariifolium]
EFSPVNEVFLCWIFVRFPRSSYPMIDSSLGKSISFDLYCLAVIFPPLCSNYYINRMEMLFIINPRPHNPTNDNTNVESFLPIPIQESDPHQEEIDVVFVADNVLPPRVENDDSDEEVDAVDILRVDNFIQNFEIGFNM